MNDDNFVPTEMTCGCGVEECFSNKNRFVYAIGTDIYLVHITSISYIVKHLHSLPTYLLYLLPSYLGGFSINLNVL
jgi:hypothetical protein